MEKIKLEEFDLLGIINLLEVRGIERYVTPVIEDGKATSYLSRSKEYYNVKTMDELSEERENLRTLLTYEGSKRNFVILENMLNCSAKVYFKKFEQYIKSGKDAMQRDNLTRAYDCLIEDSANVINILEGKKINKDDMNILPGGMENSERRFIEMDNKVMLYTFVKTLKELDTGEDCEVLTPGYGSVYIGPFMRLMCGCNFTNMLKSKYIDESARVTDFSFESLLSSERILEEDKRVLLLDDNIGTGETMKEIKNLLLDCGKNEIVSGAVQFNWRNYHRISIGDKMDIERFKVNDYEIVSPLNYAGHKLYKHAVDALNSSGADYIEYLNSKHYRIPKYFDLTGAFLRGITWAQKANLDLIGDMDESRLENEVLDCYKDSPKKITNEFSKKVIEKIRSFVDKSEVSNGSQEEFEIE